ncbi:hypothetical protein THOB06_20161 [Vibrio rotiferianus]|nr:hypothetical protein THOB06_20161 [Vibrio rotiferianus]
MESCKGVLAGQTTKLANLTEFQYIFDLNHAQILCTTITT